VSNNVIHDIYGTTYGGWGLYPDEGSTGIRLENNLVYNVKDAGFHQHYGKENLVRNNIFAFSQEGQIAVTRAEPHLSFTFERNIVYWDGGQLLGYQGWKNGAKVDLRNNLYWRAGGQPFDFAGKSWKDWQAAGNEAGSLIADPLFANPQQFDFRLLPGSPAEKIESSLSILRRRAFTATQLGKPKHNAQSFPNRSNFPRGESCDTPH